MLVVTADRKLVRAIGVPTQYVGDMAFGPAGTLFIVGTFDQWKRPFAGAVYRWRR